MNKYSGRSRMTLQLQLENGKIKEYKTYKCYSGGESNDRQKCETKCGMKWLPPLGFDSEGCSHLDCAIDIVENDIAQFKFYLKICFIVTPILYFIFSILNIKLTDFIALYCGFIIIFYLVFGGWDAYWSDIKYKELIEFRDHGTVGNVKAIRL